MSTLVEYFRHNLWANQKLLSLCADLSDELLAASAPGTYGGVRDTLVHIVANEEGYVVHCGIELRQPMLFQIARDGTFPGFDDLRARAQRTGEGLIAIAKRVRPRTVNVTWQGRSFDVPADVLLIQAINHATEHRGHVVSILSQRGVEPLQLDGWAFWASGTSPAGKPGPQETGASRSRRAKPPSSVPKKRR